MLVVVLLLLNYTSSYTCSTSTFNAIVRKQEEVVSWDIFFALELYPLLRELRI
jgi:hypothetical protein